MNDLQGHGIQSHTTPRIIELGRLEGSGVACPHCSTETQQCGWHMPGTRVLADLVCQQCGAEFLRDLPTGHGALYPTLIERQTLRSFARWPEKSWFTGWLATSYAARALNVFGVTVTSHRPIERPLILNCLDWIYGHAILKLLNAEHFLDNHQDRDLVVLIQPQLEWLVPDGVAATWAIHMPFEEGRTWSEFLDQLIHTKMKPFPHVLLGCAQPHPSPHEITISRFSSVEPLPTQAWQSAATAPVITFICRDDRMWLGSWTRFLNNRSVVHLLHLCGLGGVRRIAQALQIRRLWMRLRSQFPTIDFAVAGVAKKGWLPGEVVDMRSERPDVEREMNWCERYSHSHIVVGVHGSGMLLPSAHAGAVVEFVPPPRWGNIVQDLLPRAKDPREAIFRYRNLPDSVSTATASHAIGQLIRAFCSMRRNFVTTHRQ